MTYTQPTLAARRGASRSMIRTIQSRNPRLIPGLPLTLIAAPNQRATTAICAWLHLYWLVLRTRVELLATLSGRICNIAQEPCRTPCSELSVKVFADYPVAQLTVFTHILFMVDRPCNPDADLKRLWQLVLGTPFPACGSIARSGEAVEEDASPSMTSNERRRSNLNQPS
jgi:hypothetical protein